MTATEIVTEIDTIRLKSPENTYLRKEEELGIPFRTEGALDYGIWDDDRFVGFTGLQPHARHDIADAYYYVLADSRQRGYATLALRALTGHAFDHQLFGTVIATAPRSNQTSHGVAERAGFELADADPEFLRFVRSASVGE